MSVLKSKDFSFLRNLAKNPLPKTAGSFWFRFNRDCFEQAVHFVEFGLLGFLQLKFFIIWYKSFGTPIENIPKLKFVPSIRISTQRRVEFLNFQFHESIYFRLIPIAAPDRARFSVRFANYQRSHDGYENFHSFFKFELVQTRIQIMITVVVSEFYTVCDKWRHFFMLQL